MENRPKSPLESDKEPEKKSGDTDTSKKSKKKTTRIPLPVEKPEAAETAKTEVSKPSKGIFEEVLAKIDENAKEKEEAATSETEEDKSPETAATLDETETAESEQSSTDEEAVSEGELAASDGIIYSHPEESAKPRTAKKREASKPAESAPEKAELADTVDTPETPVDAETKPVEAENSSQEKAEATLSAEPETAPAPPEVPPPLLFPMQEAPISNETGFAAAAHNEVVPEPTDYEPADNEPLAVPTNHRMIDPNVRFGETQAAQHYRAETLKPFTESDVEDAYYYGKKHGLSRGVVSGGIVGYLFGRRGKRKAIEKADKEIAKRDEQIKELREEQIIAADRIAKVELTESYLESGLKQSEKYRSVVEIPKAVLATENTFLNPARTELIMPPTAAAERFTPYEKSAPAEKPEKAAAAKLEKSPVVASPEEQAITEETYKAPDDRRVEMSAWHRMEVDKRTGKLVENPEVAYGEAFKQEQKQELLKDLPAKEQVAPSVGHASLLGTDAAATVKPVEPAAPVSKPAEPKSPRPSPIKFLKANQDYIKQQFVSRTTDSKTWLVAFAIVVILVLTGVL